MQTRLRRCLAESSFGGGLKSGGRFYVCALCRNLDFCRLEDVLTFNLLRRRLYKFCILVQCDL